MLTLLRGLIKNLPTFILAFMLAVAVWISAVTAADPTEERLYPRQVNLELVGQDPGLLLVNAVPTQVSLTLSAPRSIWERLINEQIPVQAKADLSGLGPGIYTIPVQVTVGIRPIEIVSYTPRTLNITLESLITRSFPIHLVERGEPAVGFQAESPVLEPTSATISGPESQVNRVKEVRAILELNKANENINRSLSLFAIDENDAIITSVTINPERVNVTQAITQRGGYRNVVVKVVVTGKVASGYRVTNISVSPPTVTVFSSDPKLVDQLPGYVETAQLDLFNVKDDLEVSLPLNLPPGISAVGPQEVVVQVGIAAIEGSVTLTNMPVQVIGLNPELEVGISPDKVDVILSGPLPVLDQLTTRDIRVVLDLSGEEAGVFQRTPRIEFSIKELKVESILPGSIEVTLVEKEKLTSTPSPTPLSPGPGAQNTPVISPTPTPTPTPTK